MFVILRNQVIYSQQSILAPYSKFLSALFSHYSCCSCAGTECNRRDVIHVQVEIRGDTMSRILSILHSGSADIKHKKQEEEVLVGMKILGISISDIETVRCNRQDSKTTKSQTVNSIAYFNHERFSLKKKLPIVNNDPLDAQVVLAEELSGISIDCIMQGCEDGVSLQTMTDHFKEHIARHESEPKVEDKPIVFSCKLCLKKFKFRKALDHHHNKFHRTEENTEVKQEPFDNDYTNMCKRRKIDTTNRLETFKYAFSDIQAPTRNNTDESNAMERNMDMHESSQIETTILIEDNNGENREIEKREIKGQAGPLLFSCKLCLKKFKSRNTLDHHHKKFHKKQEPFDNDYTNMCKRIDIEIDMINRLAFTNIEPAIRNNTDESNAKERNELEDSDMSLPDTVQLNHSQNVNRNENDDCLNVAENQTQINSDHIEENPSIFLKCQFCPEKMVDLANFIEHLKEHLEPLESADVILRCSVDKCDQQFDYYLKSKGQKMCKKKQLINLEQHIRSKHSKTANIKCDECGKQLFSPGSLNLHKKQHLDKTKCYCFSCERFIHKNIYERHVSFQLCKKSDSIKMLEYSFRCNLCNKKFKTNQTLKNHEQDHSNGKTYKCEFCTKSFYRKGSMKTHLQKSHSSGEYGSLYIL